MHLNYKVTSFPKINWNVSTSQWKVCLNLNFFPLWMFSLQFIGFLFLINLTRNKKKCECVSLCLSMCVYCGFASQIFQLTKTSCKKLVDILFKYC